MKFILFILSLIVMGCSLTKPTISGSQDLVLSGEIIKNTIIECWESNNIHNVELRYDVRVKKQPASGIYGGKYIFVYEGQRVGGVTLSRCEGSSDVVIACDAVTGEYNDSTYQHEWCHVLDYQGNCLGGHPDEYSEKGCCPDWPYLSKANYQGVNNMCIQASLSDGSTLFIEVPISDSVRALDATLDKVNNPVWLKGLMISLGVLTDEPSDVVNIQTYY